MINLVHSAMRATAPIVAIPVEGGRPFAIRRELLVNTLKGLQITEAAIQMPLNPGDAPYLHIIAESAGVKGWRKFIPLRMDWEQRREIEKWAESKRKKKDVPKLTARQKHLAKLQKQVAKMRIPERPYHPLLKTSYRWHRGDWAKWKAQRSQRVLAWQLAQAYIAGGWNPKLTPAFYKQCREAGLAVRTYSSLNTRERELYSSPMDYLEKLWLFCNLEPKPEGFEPFEIEKTDIGAEHYFDWLERVRERKQTLNEIAAIESLDAAA